MERKDNILDQPLRGVAVVFIDLLLCQIPESTVAVSLGVRSCPEDKGHILS